MRVQARVQDDAEAQTAAVRSVLAGRFGAENVTVDRLLQAAAVPIGPVDAAGDAAALDLLAGQVLGDAVRIVDGAEPTAPDEIALHALATEQLGLALGDAVVLEPTGAALTVAGTWLPVDPSDPLWFGDPLVAAGALDAGAPEQRLGPAIVAESALDGLDPRPYAAFIVRPSAGLADPAALGAVRAALDGLDDALRDDPVAGRGGVIVDGRLGASLDGILRSLTAVSAVAPVPQLVVAVVAALALLPVVRLVVAAREGESLLLRARGGSAAALLRRTAAEALLVAVLPAGLAAAVVGGVVLLADGALAGGALAGPGAADAVSATAPIALRAAALALLVGLLAGMLLLALTAASTRRAGARLGAARLAAGRGAPAVSGIAIVIVLAAAALAVEQLRRSGSPLVAGAGGELVVNPLAVLAPVFALLAASLLAGALFPAVAGVVAGAARRRRSLGPVLVGRALARLGAVFAVPVLLVSLATGTAVVAAVYDASWSRGDALASALRDGADARVLLPAQPALPSRLDSPPVDLERVAALDGVDAAALAAVRPADLLDEEAGIVGVAASRLGAVSALPPARSAVIAQALAPGGGDGGALPGIPLPEGATGVAIAVDAAADPADPGGAAESAVWAVEAEGAVQRLRTGDALGPGSWTLVGIDLILPSGEPAQRVERSARITALAAITPQGEVPLALPEEWVLAPVSTARPAIGTAALEDAVTIDSGEGALGFTAVTGFVAPQIAVRFVDPAALEPVPAVVSRALADRVDRTVGDEVTLGFTGSGRELSATIEAVVDAVPAATAPAAMIVDLAAMTTQLIATSSVVPPAEQVWIAAEPTADPAALAEAAAGLLAGTAVPAGADRALVAPARDALWLGAIGAALLAVLGVAVAAAVRSAGAEREVVALRALGLSPRQQARLRVGELTAAVVVATAVGLLGGAAVAALVVPALAGAAIPPLAGVIAVPLAVDPLALGAVLAGAGLLVGLVLARTAAGVVRRARVAVPREVVA